MSDEEKGKTDRSSVSTAGWTAISALGVAVIGLAGSLATGVFQNWGNIFQSKPSPTPNPTLTIQPEQPKGSIESFVDNKVAFLENVSGQISPTVPVGNYAWLYVRPAGSGEFFFRPISIVDGGSWIVEKVQFGSSLSDRGEPPNYTIGIALFNSEDNVRLIQKRDHWKSLPSSAKSLKEMQVIRK